MAPKLSSPPNKDDAKQTKNVLSGLLIHSCAMMIVPWLLFAGTAYGWFDPLFAATIGVPETHNKNTIAAVLAVVGVNVVVGAFVLTAFREDVPKDKPKKE